MPRVSRFLVVVLLSTIFGCTPVKLPVVHEYQLSSFSAKLCHPSPRKVTLLVTMPEAAAAYQTQQMLYVTTPYQVDAFAHNAWFNPPGAMLFPLLIKSLQATGFFHAVTSTPYSDGTDYRLDTQLLTLEQNFLLKPSAIEFAAKVVLTDVKKNRVVASKIVSEHIPCPSDTPLGGVIAANQAMQLFTAAVDAFVMAHVG